MYIKLSISSRGRVVQQTDSYLGVKFFFLATLIIVLLEKIKQNKTFVFLSRKSKVKRIHKCSIGYFYSRTVFSNSVPWNAEVSPFLHSVPWKCLKKFNLRQIISNFWKFCYFKKKRLKTTALSIQNKTCCHHFLFKVFQLFCLSFNCSCSNLNPFVSFV